MIIFTLIVHMFILFIWLIVVNFTCGVQNKAIYIYIYNIFVYLPWCLFYLIVSPCSQLCWARLFFMVFCLQINYTVYFIFSLLVCSGRGSVVCGLWFWGSLIMWQNFVPHLIKLVILYCLYHYTCDVTYVSHILVKTPIVCYSLFISFDVIIIVLPRFMIQYPFCRINSTFSINEVPISLQAQPLTDTSLAQMNILGI